MHIVQPLNDPKVFGRHFKSDSWNAWRVFLTALFGLRPADRLTGLRPCWPRSAKA